MRHPTAPEQTTWYTRPFRPGDELALIWLYETVNGRTRSESELRWKVLSAGPPFPNVFVAATHDNAMLVGHYAGVPLRLKLGSSVVPCLLAVEAMTHPAFRRQGILTTLVTDAHAAWAEAGNVYLLGLPNEQWGKRTSALGYRPLFPLAWLRFPIRLDVAMARRVHLNYATGKAITSPLRAASWAWRALHAGREKADYRITAASEASDAELDKLWSRAAPSWPNAVVRDGTWVTWRYLHAEPDPFTVLIGSNGAGPAGYIAYRVTGSGARANGIVGDLFTRRGDNATASALVRSALHDLRAQGVGMALALAPPGSALYSVYRRLGFLPARRETSFPVHVVCLQPNSSLAPLADPRAWLLSGGDFDAV